MTHENPARDHHPSCYASDSGAAAHRPNRPDTAAGRELGNDAHGNPVRRLRELFDLLAEHPCAEHDALLRQAQATEEEHAAVNSLLRAQTRCKPILRAPVFDWIRRMEDCPMSEEELCGRLLGRYRLEEPIGRGGSAVVFRARHIDKPELVVAIKLINKGLYTPGGLRRFECETRILAQLKHPQIARLLDSGFSPWGMPYLTLEHVDGINIVTFANQHRLGVRKRVAMLAQACAALSAAHRRQIVHCDIKPENVLVTGAVEVKILDFGIARALDDTHVTATTDAAMSPLYAAPEQYDGGAITSGTDVYSLGVLASELLLGARLGPDAALPNAVALRFVHDRWRRLPRTLKRILATALHSDSCKRFCTAAEFGSAFEDFLADRRQPAVFAAPPSLGRRFDPAWRGAAAVAMTMLLFLAGALTSSIAPVLESAAGSAAANFSRVRIFPLTESLDLLALDDRHAVPNSHAHVHGIYFAQTNCIVDIALL